MVGFACKEVVYHLARWYIGRFIVVAYHTRTIAFIPISSCREVGAIERSYCWHFVFFCYVGLPYLFCTLIIKPHLCKSILLRIDFALTVECRHVRSNKRISVLVYQLLCFLISFVHIAHIKIHTSAKCSHGIGTYFAVAHLGFNAREQCFGHVEVV